MWSQERAKIILSTNLNTKAKGSETLWAKYNHSTSNATCGDFADITANDYLTNDTVLNHTLRIQARGGGGTPYVRMIGMIVVFFRGCDRRFSIFRGCSSEIY